MAITTPKGEQIQFVSSKTGTHNLDTYLEAAEVGNRQLSDLLDDMFDTSTGVFKADNFQFRYDTSTKQLQVRVGQFANSTSSWTDITSLFSVEGTFSTSTSYNNFDLILTSTKDLYIVHGLTAAQTFSSESNFTSSSNTTKIVDVSLAQDWAKKTDGIVDSTDHSSKAWAIGGTGVTDTASKGAAKEWAIETSGTVDTASYSSKEYAQGTQAGTGGSSKSWAQDTDQVNGASTNDRSAKSWAQGSSMTGSTLGGSAKDWAQLTGSTVDGTNYSAKYWATHSNVTTVVSNVSDIQALALKTTELGLLGTTTVVGNLGQLGTSTVVGHMANLNATNVISNIGTVAGISGNVTTVAGANTNIANLNASGVISNIGTVAGISGDVTTVAGIQSQVTAVAGISSEIQTVHTNIAKVQATANDLLETTSEIDTVANAIANVDNVGNNIANVNSVGTNIANVNTVASNISGVNSFGDRYRIASSAPSSSLDEGDLYFDTSTNKLNVYDGSNWQSTAEAASRALTSHTVTSSGTQTISVTYTVGLIDVYLNGLHLAPADYTASNGSSVVVTGCSVNDIIDIVALSAFNAANYGTAASKNIGIGTDNVPTFAANVADNDFLKIDGTTVEGRSAAEVRSDLNVADGATAYANTNVDSHLNTSGAGTNHYLKWSGSDYAWSAVDLSGYAPLAGATFTGAISGTNATLSGYLRGPSSFTIDPATHGDNTGTVVIAGNLQVDGTTTTINSTTVAIDDKVFSIATDAADSAAANASGITIGGAGATMLYTHATTSWDFNKSVNISGNITGGGSVVLPQTGVFAFASTSDEYIQGAAGTLYLGTDGGQRLRIETAQCTVTNSLVVNGNAGIGVTPTHKLHVLTTDNKGFLLDRNTGNEPASLNEYSTHYSLSIKNRTSGSYLNFGGNSGFTAIQATDGAGSATAKHIHLQPYGGNVLIGTGDAGYPAYGDNLTVGHSGDNGITIRTGSSNYGTLYFSDATGTAAGTYAGKVQYLHSDNSLRLASNGTDRVKLDSSGNTHLLTDSAYLAFGANSEVTLTHVHNQGLALNSSYLLYFNGTNNWIHAPTANEITINSNTTTTFDIGGSQKMSLNSSRLELDTLSATGYISFDYGSNNQCTIHNYSNDTTIRSHDDIILKSKWIRCFNGPGALNSLSGETEYARVTATGNWFTGPVSFGGDNTGTNLNTSISGAGSSGQVLKSNGTSSAPSWVNASSLSGVGGNWTTISESTVSNQATVNFTVAAGYWYRLYITNLYLHSATRQLFAQFSTDGGSSFISSGYAVWAKTNYASSTTVQVSTENTWNYGVMITKEHLGASADSANNMIIDYYQPTGYQFRMWGGHSNLKNSTSTHDGTFVLKDLSNNSTAVNYIRLTNYGANSSSTFNIYGKFKLLRME